MARELFFYTAESGDVAAGSARYGWELHRSDHRWGGLSTGWSHVNTVGRELFFYNAESGDCRRGSARYGWELHRSDHRWRLVDGLDARERRWPGTVLL